MTLRALLAVSPLVVLLSSCGQSPRVNEDQTLVSMEQRILADIDQKLEDLWIRTNNEMAPKSAYNRANTLGTQITDIEGRLATLEKNLSESLADEDQAEDLLSPIHEALAQLSGRIDSVEGDMNATLDDLYRMREEVRLVLVTLDSYRNASREVLEFQRESLSRQLRTLDAVLDPVADPASQ